MQAFSCGVPSIQMITSKRKLLHGAHFCRLRVINYARLFRSRICRRSLLANEMRFDFHREQGISSEIVSPYFSDKRMRTKLWNTDKTYTYVN